MSTAVGGAERRARRRAALAALIVALVAALASWDTVPLLRRIDLAVFDGFQRLSPRRYDAEAPVRIVAIDGDALDRFGQWPWPRPVLAELVTRLRDAGAAAIGFDVIFSEPDRTSPEEIARSLTAAGADVTAVPAQAGESHDAIFARAIAAAPVIFGAIPTLASNDRVPAIKAQPSFLGSDTRAALFGFAGADINLPILAEAAAGIGSMALAPQDREDGLIRRTPLAVRVGNTVIPALSVEMLRVAQGARGYLIRSSDAAGEAAVVTPVITGFRVGAIPLETSADGAVWVRYAGHRPERLISAAHILSMEPEDLRKAVEGRLMIVAGTAPGLGDIVATPMSATVPGAEVHAEILEQTLAGASLRRPDWAQGAERAAAIGAGVLIAIIFLTLGPVAAAIVTGAAVIAVPVAGFVAFRDHGLLLGSALPVIGGGLAWSAAALSDYLGARRERREIRRQFEHFVAPEVIADIERDPERHMIPGGEERELTILFADLRSFSGISAEMDPQALIGWLNAYLTPMTEAVIQEKGTIDKFIGDAIMAFWNAPRRDPDHARQALRGALAMTQAMRALNRRFSAEGRPLARIGIGLNTGACSVGRIGARKRLDYTCIGDAVNVASRIEGLTKLYATTILIGEDTAAQAADFALIEIDRVAVKGRDGRPVSVYALAGDERLAGAPEFEAVQARWSDALSAYRARDFEGAERRFARIAEGGTEPIELSGAARVMRLRSAEFAAQPPPEDWGGVYQAQSK